MPARRSPSSVSVASASPVASPSAQPVAAAARRDPAVVAVVNTGRPGRRRAAGVQQALNVPLRTLGQPGRARHVPVTASCGGCDRRWTDEDATHCRGCHGHWADLAGFDEHLADCPKYIPIESPPRSRPRKTFK